MSDVMISLEEMRIMDASCAKGKSAAATAKSGVESLRKTLKQMYKGQASNYVEEYCQELESQYLLIENSFKKLSDYMYNYNLNMAMSDADAKYDVEKVVNFREYQDH